MDLFFQRFSHLSVAVFSQLDNEYLMKCKEVSKPWCNYIKKQKLPWIRMIEKSVGYINDKDFPKTWSKVMCKTSLEFIEELAKTADNFYKSHLSIFDSAWSPLHIAAGCGNLDICQFIIDRISVFHITNDKRYTPLHVAAYGGHLEIYKLICESYKNNHLHSDLKKE